MTSVEPRALGSLCSNGWELTEQGRVGFGMDLLGDGD